MKRNCPRCGLVPFRRMPTSSNYSLCTKCKTFAFSQKTKKFIYYRIRLFCPNCTALKTFRKIPHKDYVACETCKIRYSPNYLPNKGSMFPFFEKGKSPSVLTHSNKIWRKQTTALARQKVADRTTKGKIVCYDAYMGYGKKTKCHGRMEFHEIHCIRHYSEPSYILGNLADFIQVCHAHHTRRNKKQKKDGKCFMAYP